MKKVLLKNNKFARTYKKLEEIQKLPFWNEIQSWPGRTPEEKCYLKFHNMTEPQKCLACGVTLPFISYYRGYGPRRFCSVRCGTTYVTKHSPELVKMRAERHRAAMMAKYGVANAFQLYSSIDKIQKKRRMQMDSIVEKMERTNEAKYGVSDWMKDPVRYAEFSKR